VPPKREVATKMKTVRNVADSPVALGLVWPPLLVLPDWPENSRLLEIVMNCTTEWNSEIDHRDFHIGQRYYYYNDFLPVLPLVILLVKKLEESRLQLLL